MLRMAISAVTAAMNPLTPTAALVACSAELSSSMVGQYHAMKTSQLSYIAAVLNPSLSIFVFHHLAALHHKFHMFQRGHVFERIAIDCDEVGPGSGLEASHFS